MIKANELRLGNKFIEKYSKELIEVIELKKEVIVFSGDFKDNWQAEPIPLTEEILLKCGFIKGILQIQDTFVCIKYMFNKFPLVLDVGGERCALYDIEYLHQLQNLYFATTKKELKINL